MRNLLVSSKPLSVDDNRPQILARFEAATQPNSEGLAWFQEISAWRESARAICDCLLTLNEPLTSPLARFYPICYGLLGNHPLLRFQNHQSTTMPAKFVARFYEVLLKHLHVIDLNYLPTWSDLHARSLTIGGEPFVRASLPRANEFIIAGSFEHGFSILRGCLESRCGLTFNLCAEIITLILPILPDLQALERVPAGSHLHCLAHYLHPIWLRYTHVDDLAAIRVLAEWILDYFEHPILRTLHADLIHALDLAAAFGKGIRQMLLGIRSHKQASEEHRTFHNHIYGRFAAAFTDLALRYPEHAALNQVFLILKEAAVDRITLIRHLLIVGQITNREIQLAAENPAEYWWHEIEDSGTDADLSSLSLNSIRFFRELAKAEFETVREALLSLLESAPQCWEEFEVRLRFMAILVETQKDERVMELACNMIQQALPMEHFAIAIIWRLLLSQIIRHCSEESPLIDFALQKIREDLVPDENCPFQITMAFVLLNSLPSSAWINSPDIAPQAIACSGLCLSLDRFDVIAEFKERGIRLDAATSLPFIRDVIDEIANANRNLGRLEGMIVQLCTLLINETVTADPNTFQELIHAMESADDRLGRQFIFQLLGAILAHTGPDQPIGVWCLRRIYELERDTTVYLADRALALTPLLNRNLRAIPVDVVLATVNPLAFEIEELDPIDLVRWETFICRIIWGSSQESVMQGAQMIRSAMSQIVSVAANDRMIPDRLVDVIFMEVVLTEIAAGIYNVDDVLQMLRRLPMTAVTNYHRKLAVNVLSPFFAQESRLAEEFGEILPEILEGRINEDVLRAFVTLSGVEMFDEDEALKQGEVPPGFRSVKIEIDQ